MTHIDDAIRRALSPEDLKAYEDLSRDRNPFQEAIGAFQSQHAAFAVGSWLGGLAMLILAAYAAWRASGALDMREMLGWAALAAFGVFSLGLIKLWFWMEMQKNSVLREIKRLELQVASLVATRG